MILSACTNIPQPTLHPLDQGKTVVATATGVATSEPTPTPVPPRVLTVCMGSEPASLFLYGDNSVAARSVRQAIYDGPYDIRNFAVSPVILEKEPSLADGDAVLESVQVQPGDLIQDSQGNLTNLADGVHYRPSGCNRSDCAAAYSGQEPVAMDQLVVRFKLRPGLQWSDRTPLTADDSVYSYEVAKGLYPRARADLIAHTQSYQALDATTVEWRGIPGYQDPTYQTNFFTPLPRHAWGSLSPQDLLTAEVSSQKPLGWGPYVVDEWTSGDHITLSKNSAYFRAGEGLPYFDKLVFRFVENQDAALNALLAGECDYVDESAMLESKGQELLQLQDAGRLKVELETGTAWEHADFGIVPLAGDGGAQNPPDLFQLKETRQAVAMCIDRQKMADEVFFGKSQVLDTYVPPEHPLYNPDVKHYAFDPQAASAMLQSVGWLDNDNDPSTPRLAQGVPGVPDGTPFKFSYLTTSDDEKQRAAKILQASLAQCGIQVDIQSESWDKLFAPGPDGPVFGRHFSMAQFAWITSLEPPCFLYTTSEIPGPYPDYPKGWGGANVSGYSNAEYDQACQQALSSLPGTPEYKQANDKAQAIFAEDLPAIPLYSRLKVVAMRPDMCGVAVDPSAESELWNLEAFNYGEGCNK